MITSGAVSAPVLPITGVSACRHAAPHDLAGALRLPADALHEPLLPAPFHVLREVGIIPQRQEFLPLEYMSHR